MSTTTRVDLHLHSNLSDGRLRPDELASLLARWHVAAAALTDHDTVEGLPSFRLALRRKGIGHISGVEITTFLDGREIHLLAYGFDPGNRELLSTLASVRQALRGSRLYSVEAGLRERMGAVENVPSASHSGRLDTVAAIDLVHRCDGLCFLAHPLQVHREIAQLEPVVARLVAAGLDGIEAIYHGYDLAQVEQLAALARRHNLLMSAGSDFHGSAGGRREVGMEMPNAMWKALRDRVDGDTGGLAGRALTGHRGWGGERRFFFHIIFPTGLAILLFVVAIWGFFLPKFERSLLDRKREMIRELANVTVGIVSEAYDAQQRGEMTQDQAQRAAAARIEPLRYGREGKDYFWVQDSTPRIIMHPYRKDLNGQDVSEFRDPRGTRIFVEFADMVRRRKEGYVEYVWQWKDDPQRLVPKESYLRGFEPWGWIIGTGLYIDDVRQEISRIERGLVYGSLAIAIAMAGLLVFVVRESQHMEKERSDAEEHLEESHQQYRSLVEAATEGTLLIVGERCRYANSAMLRLLGAENRQLQLMDLEDVLPHCPQNATVWEAVRCAQAGEEAAPAAEGQLNSADGRRTALITVTPIQLVNETGLALRVSKGAASSSGSAVALSRRESDIQQITAAITASETPERIAELCRRASSVHGGWAEDGLPPQWITTSSSVLCDAATRRLVDLAVQRTGTPPVSFTFIALGSQGRQEQTLYTDQDNAIILEGELHNEADRAYFSQVGAFVNQWLNASGYIFCRGEVMAQNSRWCVALDTWIQYFEGWISKAEPAQLLDISICFDLRAISGNIALVDSLRKRVNTAIQATPGFLPLFARNAMEYKAPLRLFGRIVASEMPGKLDLKDAMMPIVSFARLYALRQGLSTTNTVQRLRELTAAGALAGPTLRDLVIAYDFLTSLRLKHQASRLRLGEPLDNSIDYQQLSHIEATLLRETFREIDTIQQKIRYELLGGGHSEG